MARKTAGKPAPSNKAAPKRKKAAGRPRKAQVRRGPIVIARILDGLRKGTPLAELCREPRMPDPSTWRDWCDTDEVLAIAYARAREDGFDAIAVEALRIADTPMEGERRKETEEGTEVVREDMLGHRKLQVETRLKLLAKWDPKRYGEMIKHANAEGGNMDIAGAIMAGNARIEGCA